MQIDRTNEEDFPWGHEMYFISVNIIIFCGQNISVTLKRIFFIQLLHCHMDFIITNKKTPYFRLFSTERDIYSLYKILPIGVSYRYEKMAIFFAPITS